MEMLPPEEMADLSERELFLLAASGDARVQETACYRLLAPMQGDLHTLASAELWASMATERGHKLSYMTLAQICAARGGVYASAEREGLAVENLAQALAMFDVLAAADDPHASRMSDRIFAGLKMDGCEAIHQAVLRRAKEMQTA